jgi:hypothetical protein
VGKIVLVALLVVVGLWLAIHALITTDADRVEAEIERLVDVARKGGDAAAAEILAALADDYRGSGMYARERIERYLDAYVAQGPPEEVWTGDVFPIPVGDGILVPLVRVHVRTKRGEGDALLRVTFAKRGDRFRILNVEPWRSER